MTTGTWFRMVIATCLLAIQYGTNARYDNAVAMIKRLGAGVLHEQDTLSACDAVLTQKNAAHITYVDFPPYSAVTDDDLIWLQAIPSLRRLYLTGHPITDRGLVHLATLTSLRTLDLGATAISDDGLRHLEQLRDLEWISLIGAENVTERGIIRLQAALPQTKIWR